MNVLCAAHNKVLYMHVHTFLYGVLLEFLERQHDN